MNIKMIHIALFLLCLNISSCAQGEVSEDTNENQPPIITTKEASIVNVSVSGDVNNYNFSVGISSPDKDCEQYANWWEVITEDGTLLYRRILGHSHVNEQPFVRSGGPVAINDNQVVLVRAHMNTSGYGTIIFRGSVSNGFIQDTLASDFASNLERLNPQPSGCAF